MKKLFNENCPFCNIVSGKAEGSIIYEDDSVLAFMDLIPARVGHALVIPREHYENIYDVPEEVFVKIALVVKRVSVAVKKTFDADGVKVIQLNGRAAGQVVFHIHFHVIPIVNASGAEIGHFGRIKIQRSELDETAQKIRKNL